VSARGARAEGELRFAHELADIADSLTVPAFRAGLEAGGLDTEAKADGSPVTEVDVAVERALRGEIRGRRPDHGVFGEEDGRDGPEDAPTWFIDPIDATKNFVRGVPVFATLIALTEGDRGVAAVITAPALGTRWDGVVGGPARQDGREIRVSSTRRLADAQVSLGGLNYFEAGGWFAAVERFATRTARQRGFGDFWQHCLVASGAVDVAVEADVNRWDLAAPRVIVEAAGGRFTDLRGVETDDGGSAVSSNGQLHDQVLALLRG
jgi:histidinol-phosphatase